ncbi:ribonuclease HII [Microbacterium thalli]|uniref:Ribonuclease n=1 Tax=Microbacterium thalli TaxID=3027921 RepID=A0ABT5SKP3_9MICO|nr:ribonuclease HII [Microbacterium thalli]MDD7929783.1 ribonuclease HII [Microbacterium thalli]MDD7962716.1 ribonuclease HII [Microbacterium thalli]MDN8547633.1 ribonuclease HII [Microbacterium thalli]
MTVVAPRLTVERRLLREHAFVIALDEVGRGALAGPVAVGAAVLDARCARRRIPDGLRDSKLVTELRRPALAERAAGWVVDSAVGWATPAEIDERGIIRALGLAAVRALAGLTGVDPMASDAVVILDGNHDYVSPVAGPGLTIQTIVKADRDCASAAAASVIAKVARDAHMTALHDETPVYEWARNKGYASAVHREAIRSHGLSGHHRASWAIADAPTLF